VLSLIRRTTGLLGGSGRESRPRGCEARPCEAVVSTGPPYCRLLAHDADTADDARAEAWRRLEKEMVLVPAGSVNLASTEPESFAVEEPEVTWHPVGVTSLYMDRFAVTNGEFAQFVDSGAYGNPDLWPRQILPSLLTFVDSTGVPGPRYWSHGTPPPEKEDHPVVGVSWYEAYAYAGWIGKRLPTPAEWQRAATWFYHSKNGGETRYPWGDGFDPARANIAQGSRGATVPVDEYHQGCTPNGIYQLVGNTWEWVAALFDCGGDREGLRLVFDHVMGEMRGGAFDTYFGSHGTVQFRSGQSLHYRGPNVGVRCCVSADELESPPDSLLLETGETEL